MPTYEYACRSCGKHLEVVQSFTDDALTSCPSCAGPLRKVFGSIGITFKGKGFYKTDSRSSVSSSRNGGDSDKPEKEREKKDKSTEKSEKSEKSETKKAESGTDRKSADTKTSTSSSGSDTKSAKPAKSA